MNINSNVKSQSRGETLSQNEIYYRDTWCELHSEYFKAIAVRLRPKTHASIQDLFLVICEQWWLLHRPSWGSRRVAAFHEAGHFVASEALGLHAVKAEINGSLFGKGSWGGSALSALSLLHKGPFRRPRITADLVRREAIVTLAGPAAEAVLAGGDFYESPGEIMTVILLVAWLARRAGSEFQQELLGILKSTARLVYGHQSSIEAVASQLTKKRLVEIFRPSTDKLLETVLKREHNDVPNATPKQIATLLRLMAETPVDLTPLVRMMAPSAL